MFHREVHQTLGKKVAMADFALMNLDGGKNLAMNFSFTSSKCWDFCLDVIGAMSLPYLSRRMGKL